MAQIGYNADLPIQRSEATLGGIYDTAVGERDRLVRLHEAMARMSERVTGFGMGPSQQPSAKVAEVPRGVLEAIRLEQDEIRTLLEQIEVLAYQLEQRL